MSAHLAAANRPKLKAIETKKVKEYPQGQFKSVLQLLESCGSGGYKNLISLGFKTPEGYTLPSISCLDVHKKNLSETRIEEHVQASFLDEVNKSNVNFL